MTRQNKLMNMHRSAQHPADALYTPSNLCGLLVIDKPIGVSSMHAVTVVRRKAGGVRTGHAGTLDPLATGVLVLALGQATRSIDQLMATEKRYRTTIDLRAFTSTDDTEGERTEVSVPSPPGEADVRSALLGFVGCFPQRPPIFSAVKVGGRRAYKLARRGEAVDLQAREVRVHQLELVRFNWPFMELDIHCDKGFYVRSLARDLGKVLGTGGHCTAIQRTAVGPFTLQSARSIESLPASLGQEDLMCIDTALDLIDAARRSSSDRT